MPEDITKENHPVVWPCGPEHLNRLPFPHLPTQFATTPCTPCSQPMTRRTTVTTLAPGSGPLRQASRLPWPQRTQRTRATNNPQPAAQINRLCNQPSRYPPILPTVSNRVSAMTKKKPRTQCSLDDISPQPAKSSRGPSCLFLKSGERVGGQQVGTALRVNQAFREVIGATLYIHRSWANNR